MSSNIILFLFVFFYLKKDNIPFIAFMVLQGENRRVKRILIGTTHKSLYKNENRNTKNEQKKSSPRGSHLYALSQDYFYFFCSKNKLNKDDIYR